MLHFIHHKYFPSPPTVLPNHPSPSQIPRGSSPGFHGGCDSLSSPRSHTTRGPGVSSRIPLWLLILITDYSRDCKRSHEETLPPTFSLLRRTSLFLDLVDSRNSSTGRHFFRRGPMDFRMDLKWILVQSGWPSFLSSRTGLSYELLRLLPTIHIEQYLIT